MTKEELVSALKEAVGGTPYGDAIVEEAAETFGDKDKKYGQDMKDRLDEKLGVLKAYARIHAEAGAEAKAVAEDEKIAIVEKALAALK
jgi:NTP pyrophosphatase (non-canonical NTP hydrolase)